MQAHHLAGQLGILYEHRLGTRHTHSLQEEYVDDMSISFRTFDKVPGAFEMCSYVA